MGHTRFMENARGKTKFSSKKSERCTQKIEELMKHFIVFIVLLLKQWIISFLNNLLSEESLKYDKCIISSSHCTRVKIYSLLLRLWLFDALPPSKAMPFLLGCPDVGQLYFTILQAAADVQLFASSFIYRAQWACGGIEDAYSVKGSSRGIGAQWPHRCLRAGCWMR